MNTSNILVPKPRGVKDRVGIATPELIANIGAPSGPSATSFMTSGADTSFGTRSGGGFKLASDASIAVEKIINTIDYECEGQSYDCQGQGEYAPMLNATPEFGAAPTAMSETDEANPNDSLGPKPEGATAIEYGLIAALIGGTADPGREGTYKTTTGEVDASKTFDYCVIYPERCTVSQIERPTFGPHMVTLDNLASSPDPGDHDV